MGIVRIIKHWEVDIDDITYHCTIEPKRFIDYYELKTTKDVIIHHMVKDLSYISWKAIYED